VVRSGIHEVTTKTEVAPNLREYDAEAESFSWQAVARELDGLPAGGRNIAYEAIDRHALGPHGDRTALRFRGKEGTTRDYTYRQLQELTNRFANVLRGLGIGAGDPIVTLLGAVPEVHVAAFGALKNRSVFCPLYAAFGPEPIRVRLNLAKARVLVTTEALFRRKIQPQLDPLPFLECVLVCEPSGDSPPAPPCRNLTDLLAEADPRFQVEPTERDHG